MPYTNCKIYFDGSHYIAVPYDNFSHSKRKSKSITYTHEKADFEKAFEESKLLPKKEREKYIAEQLQQHFPDEQTTQEFMQEQILRKRTNAIKRRTRLMRKVYLQEWNYFVTFTYDSNKLDEKSFKKKLMNTLKHLVSRKQWKYIGVWERSPEKQRLHFHGIFYIQEMIGKLEPVTDYNTKSHRKQITYKNTHFLKHFGRNDFKEIDTQQDIIQSVRYLLKYIEKSGERLVYGGKIPTYFVSDIMDDDIVCLYGIEDKKFLLFDDFKCFDEGVFMGNVSSEVIKQLPKSN